MRNILNLLKLQIDNKTDVLKTKSPKKMLLALLKVFVLLIAVSVVSWFIAVRIFILGIRINAELIGIILLVTQIISLLFAIAHIINTLYLNKDNEMLICLPVTPNQLFLSKIILIYLKELMVNAMIMIPIFLNLGIMGRFGISFYLALVLFLLVLPILPIVLASFISICIMGIIKFLKKHLLLSIIVTLSFVLVCLVAYIILVSGIMDSFNIATDQLETVKSINMNISEVGKNIFVYYQLGLAMTGFKRWTYIILFILACVVLFYITILVIRPFYFNTAMTSLENNINFKNKKGKFKKRSVFVSLMAKETKSVFRSSSDIFEYFLFTLLMPFIVFTYDKLLMSITVSQAGVNMIAGSHVMVVGILAMLSNIISSAAISKEGGNFYISKVIPVNYYTQIFAKLTFNVIFTIGSLLVTMIVSCFIYPVWRVVLGTIAVMFTSIGHAAMSIDMDIKKPTIKFEGDGSSSAVSRSTRKSILLGLLIGFILGLIIILMSSYKYAVVPYLIIIAIGLIFMVHRLYILILRINLQYDKIEM